ncbi:MAG: DsrE/DsrF/DrsH-like family protein [Thermoguttaceae bacterium]|nr:DsrE/DsrF/DrsH-like family protein [Thermoguttaceae bacterium]
MKTTLLKSCFAVATLLGVLIGSAGAQEDSVTKPVKPVLRKPTLVINLTSGESDLHAVTMGLHFAEHGLADNREVVIFFNVKSPPLARKDLPDSVRFGEMPSIREMIAKLRESGVKMVVCPMCAEITGVKAEELAPGIEMIKDRKQIFDHLHVNSVVFTY